MMKLLLSHHAKRLIVNRQRKLGLVDPVAYNVQRKEATGRKVFVPKRSIVSRFLWETRFGARATKEPHRDVPPQV
jgi:hypothetical protein